jgi:hypothetical protein
VWFHTWILRLIWHACTSACCFCLSFRKSLHYISESSFWLGLQNQKLGGKPFLFMQKRLHL